MLWCVNQNDMGWTDRIRNVKIILVAAAILIAVGSLLVSHFLTRDLKQQERHKMEVWAEAMRTLNLADDNTDLNLVLKVLNDNNYIPVILLNKDSEVTDFRNVRLKAVSHEDSIRKVRKLGLSWLAEHHNIRIDLDEQSKDYVDVCYDESLFLKRLSWYPFVQLGVVLIFVVVAIFALLAFKRAEQNKVWVGLSKETAHQLGTPISSLMAWVEILKETYPDDELIPEMNKDVERLQLIADRFSKVGSVPELKDTSLNDLVDRVIAYMDRRTGKSVQLIRQFPDHDVRVVMNASLIEWVLENLTKNAVDAMSGVQGTITFRIEEQAKKVLLYVSDTGKGIRKKDVDNVFKPGFTTKKRGWGLGLSLARRIVEEYHRGRIYVSSSEVGRGTTFCIEMKKY